MFDKKRVLREEIYQKMLKKVVKAKEELNHLHKLLERNIFNID